MTIPSVPAKTRSAALVAMLFGACHAACAAIADATAECGAPESLQCRLDTVLSILDDIGIVLGFALFVIIVIALRIYLRNRKSKNLLHD